MIAIIDYGVGNLFSLSSSLSHIGLENTVTRDLAVINGADKVILPGVGAFGDAKNKLDEFGLTEVIKNVAKEKPLLGICLGMQLLFDKSYEYGEHEGLGLISGDICPLRDDIDLGLKVPHIGWNSLKIANTNCPVMKYTKDGDYVYYVHSFYAKKCTESIVATSFYGTEVPGICANGNVIGIQFHPEKSGEVGLEILKAFGEMK